MGAQKSGTRLKNSNKRQVRGAVWPTEGRGWEGCFLQFMTSPSMSSSAHFLRSALPQASLHPHKLHLLTRWFLSFEKTVLLTLRHPLPPSHFGLPFLDKPFGRTTFPASASLLPGSSGNLQDKAFAPLTTQRVFSLFTGQELEPNTFLE